MSEHELELRLRGVARALDAAAPTFDPASLRTESRRRWPHMLIALAAVAALAAVTAAPAAISALRDLFEVELVPELQADVPGTAPPFLGEPVPRDAAATVVPFGIRTIAAFGAPDAYYGREDIRGGMVIVAYDGTRILLAQWRLADVNTRVSVVPVSGTADDVTVDGRSALWIAGTARGLFTVIGADGTVHRELFDVAEGALLWERDGVAFLLQGAGTREHALELASSVAP